MLLCYIVYQRLNFFPIREKQEGETTDEYLAYVRETQAKNNELRKQRAQGKCRT